MRVLRRIANCPRYEGGGPSYLQVVQQLGQMPTDIWLLHKRLKLLPKTLGTGAPPLLAALMTQHGTRARSQLAADLVFAWHAFPRLWGMPHPRDDWKKWVCLIRDSGRWQACLSEWDDASTGFGVDRPVYVDVHASAGGAAGEASDFICRLCPEGEARVCSSAAALASHQRLAHGAITVERCLLRQSGNPCARPICGSKFGSEARTAVHLRDTTCRKYVGLRSFSL